MDELGLILRKAERFAESEAVYREALAIWKSRGIVNIEYELTELTEMLRDQGKLAEIEVLCRENVDNIRKSPSQTRLPYALHLLGIALRNQKRLPEAEASSREAIELAKKLKLPASESLPTLHQGLVEILLDQGRWAEAKPLIEKALELTQNSPASWSLAQTYGFAGRVYAAEGNWAKAETMHRKGLEISRRITNETEQHQWLAWGVADALRHQEKWAEAEVFYRECITICVRLWPHNPRRWEGQLNELKTVLRCQGKTKEAIRREIQALAKGADLPDLLPEVLFRLGDALREQTTWLEAEPLLAEALATAKKSPLSAAHANEFSLQAMKLATLQIWFGREAEHTALCQQMLPWFMTQEGPEFADRIAKITNLRPPAEPRLLETTLALARRAVEIGQTNSNFPWFQLSLGLAEYRNGHYLEADRMLSAAELAGTNTWRPDIRAGTARFYRALSLFRQGQPAKARQLFSQAEASMKPLPAAGLWPLTGDADQDDLILWLACKEARVLLNVPSE